MKRSWQSKSMNDLVGGPSSLVCLTDIYIDDQRKWVHPESDEAPRERETDESGAEESSKRDWEVIGERQKQGLANAGAQ